MGPSIKYVMANFDPAFPCHTLSHIPGPPKVRHTSLTPDFQQAQYKNPDKSPLYKFSLNCSWGFYPGWFCQEVFCLEGFVRGGFCPFSLLSEYICYNRKLNVMLNFMFHMCDKKIYKSDVTCSGPLPLSQTVTPSRTPSPLERDVLYGRPLCGLARGISKTSHTFLQICFFSE